MKTDIPLKNKDIRNFATKSTLHFVGVMFSHSAGTQEGKDIEHLHDMRVASRRLRECFQVFEAFYSPKKLRTVLSTVKKITKLLGRPRETDVNVSLLRAYQPGSSPVLKTTHEYLLEIFESEQARRRRKMFKQIQKIDQGDLESRLSQFARTARLRGSRSSLLGGVGQELEFEGFLKISTNDLQQKAAEIFAFEAAPAREEHETRLHQLRIDTKKFRYRLEILNAAYGEQFSKAISLAEDLQDIIGWAHDYGVVIAQLESHWQYLNRKSRERLARGCQSTIAEFMELKESYLHRVEPSRIGFLEELSRLRLSPATDLFPGRARLDRQVASSQVTQAQRNTVPSGSCKKNP